MRRLGGVARFCDWCGKRVNGWTYMVRGVLTFCSEECWRAWENHFRDSGDDSDRWEDDGGR